MNDSTDIFAIIKLNKINVSLQMAARKMKRLYILFFSNLRTMMLKMRRDFGET